MNHELQGAIHSTPTYMKLHDKTIEIEGELWTVSIFGSDDLSVFLNSLKDATVVMSISTEIYDEKLGQLLSKSEINRRKTAQWIAKKIQARIMDELKVSLDVAEKFQIRD